MRARKDGIPKASVYPMRPWAGPPCAACSAVAGAAAAGWPTSMWTTRRPDASIAAAAAITSMTINGGTLLRLEGINRGFAASSIVNGRSGLTPCPAVAAFGGFLGLLGPCAFHDSFVIVACVDRYPARH